MTEFEGQIWVAQDNDNVYFICTTKRIKKKIQGINEKGRDLRLSEEKLLWQHPSLAHDVEDWQLKISTIHSEVNSLTKEIDIELLWENALELEISEIKELADLYFGGEITTEHLMAIWRGIADDRLHFKRRSRNWEPRAAEQVQELKQQREREEARVRAIKLAQDWLQKMAKLPLPIFLHLSKDQEVDKFQVTAISDDILPFVERLEAWLRGDADKEVDELIRPTAALAKLTERELVFEILQKIGRLPIDADRDVIIAGLKPEFSSAVNAAAQALQVASDESITEISFSIDDEDTREVDDALAIERDGSNWKISIAIADPANLIKRGDSLDKEAMRRGTTVYLPTQHLLMLPPYLSCDVASLTAGEARSSIIIRVWLDDQGDITNSTISRETVKVLKRLHYSDADKLIAESEDQMADDLRNLLDCAKNVQNKRIDNGAFNLQRQEYKIGVENNEIKLAVLERNSPSRTLVSEMMVLANHVAAKYADKHQVPLIYRVQTPPSEPISKEMMTDPLGFHKVRKFLGRSSLSLQAGQHSGLGLSMYTQFTSPLRRFADLVMQRQLIAHSTGEEIPYNEEELFQVLETAERTARESRGLEGEAKKRLLMLYLKQDWGSKPIEALIITEVKGGYKVEMQPWGADAYLATGSSFEMGDSVTTYAERIRVKAGTIRLKLLR
ncbi:ribonuclease catalytic domain-containing protein [Candidatus Marithrix sp. Canyon 246]|uniref:ribonuclease catalytic domain-containing protein n=1 Tax=Candidatus Marithrix sp. Canyon 246 TaxID=1827136 RepID=UPI000849FC8D|nr:ribonuclease catalytic domain-containing protein [Candidatus Marithrix sp. Canyon 246]